MRAGEYPLFRPLALADKNLFDVAFTDNEPVISEFTFTNLYSWRDVYKLSLATLDGMIVLKSEKSAVPKFFPPIGSGVIKDTVIKILDDSGGSIIRLPASFADLFSKGGNFVLNDDRDNADYVYNVADLVKLAGKKYDGKRNLVHKFKSSFDYEYMELDGSNAGECLLFEDRWCSLKNCDIIEGLDNERRAVREMIANYSAFALIGGSIKVNGAVSAVAIGEKLNKKTVVMHILKADANISGLYQVMLQEFLTRNGSSFEYVNLEQDLGEPGLRKFKLSYHPVYLIDKYTLTMKGRKTVESKVTIQ